MYITGSYNCTIHYEELLFFAYEKNKYSDEYWLQEFLRKQNLLSDKFFNEKKNEILSQKFNQ